MTFGVEYRHRVFWLAPLASFFALAAVPARAQFWNKKSYTQWSEKECRQMLANSPWAQTQTFGGVELPSGAQGSIVPGRQPLITFSYTAIFFSAMPIREAQVRLGQIQAHYAEMSAEQKQAFDQNAARYLTVQFPTDIVIQVTYSTNVDAYRSSLETFWQTQTTAKLRNSSYLHLSGRSIPLSRYKFAPEQHGFFLFFPRQLEGTPVLHPGEKSLALQVTRSVLNATNGMAAANSVVAQRPPAGNILLEYDVRKMMFDGRLAF